MGEGLEFQHDCSFCGWMRASATPVMLSPSCKRCGCALDARAANGAPAAVSEWAVPPVAASVLRWIGVLLGLLALYAAAKLGYALGGPAGAIIAFGVGGFLMLPFVPEQV